MRAKGDWHLHVKTNFCLKDPPKQTSGNRFESGQRFLLVKTCLPRKFHRMLAKASQREWVSLVMCDVCLSFSTCSRGLRRLYVFPLPLLSPRFETCQLRTSPNDHIGCDTACGDFNPCVQGALAQTLNSRRVLWRGAHNSN